METAKNILAALFTELDGRIAEINEQRREDGALPLSKAKVQLLGQMSLLSNERASAILHLAQTGDLDAFLTMENLVKKELTIALKKYGLIYDEDSPLIWIPPQSKFSVLFDFKRIKVEAIDPESALVSKAVKAPDKNLQLIREAIAADSFPHLVDRILANGGSLEDFI